MTTKNIKNHEDEHFYFNLIPQIQITSNNTETTQTTSRMLKKLSCSRALFYTERICIRIPIQMSTSPTLRDVTPRVRETSIYSFLGDRPTTTCPLKMIIFSEAPIDIPISIVTITNSM